ncbi:AI-2E family transporter [Enterobacillus tribolii]|uniref:AI-2 transport protein TqsA n=1 Tax=Enterobacillus tribolii TaxID=1487935 RepID=A0A370R375_9GAMM|nr:AI-2E family transporter [Enterobacillus tribolii]MBW7983926.1 AI-2E family transporter [Enterobacillus tribolii]RDK96863.1 AI-2 transport protein TqsA [Enterobacillus tribolii]
MSRAGLTTKGLRIALMAGMLVIILAGIKAAADIVVPFLLALFIAIILHPVVRALVRMRIPRVLAITLMMAAIILLFSLLLGVLGASVTDFSRTLPQYRGMLVRRLAELQSVADLINLSFSPEDLAGYFDPGVLMNMATRTVTHLSGAMSSLFLLLMTVVFMLLEAPYLPGKLRQALAGSGAAMDSVDKALHGVTHYLALKTAISVLTGVVVWLMLTFLGIRFALMWGVLAFVLNYIPNIGSVLAAIPPVIQTLLFGSVSDAMVVTVGYVVINMVLGNMLEPRVMGRGLGLSTLVVFLSLIFWGWLLGTVGMLLSVPLTIVAKILLEMTPVGHRFAVLLGDGKEPEVQK